MSAEALPPRVLELLRFTEAHNRHTHAIARVTGERFNIFEILGVGHLEVKTHSPILAELLNPTGTHGQGAVFLRLFVERFISNWAPRSKAELPKVSMRSFDADGTGVTVTTEYHAGPKDEKPGGRIDIFVRDENGETIVIENKIYAGDQDKQMERYRESYPNAHLFYLTLDGREPTNQSVVRGLRCISYKHDILSWLNDCRKEAACAHTVREIISQYIHLIDTLTGQSTTILMNKELIDEIVRGKESLEAFFTLKEAEKGVQDSLVAGFNVKLDDIAKSADLELCQTKASWSQKGDGFSFGSELLSKHGLEILFEFEKGGFRDFYFGFATKGGPLDEATISRLKTLFEVHFELGRELTRNVPVWAWWPHPNWTHLQFEALRNGVFENDVKSTLGKLAKIAHQALSSDAISETP